MSTYTTITVNDRESTPIAHDYTPNGEYDNVFTFVERSGIPLGDSKITISKSETNNGNFKVRIRMSDPILATETINGIDDPKVIRTAYANLEFTFSNRSSVQERDNMIGKLRHMLSSSTPTVMAVARDLENLY